jgi:hypothetical protein
MSRRPDFYCFFYCAARDGQREPETQHHGAGSHPSAEGSPKAARRASCSRHLGGVGRSSGSCRVRLQVQRLIPNGRPGIDGLRVWQTSPLGSNRRGR